MRTIASPIAVLALLLSVAAVAAAHDRPAGRDLCTGPQCSLLCLDADDDGRTVHLRQGELVMISLAANPSTGFSWHRESIDPGILLPMCNGFTPDRPQLQGSGGLSRCFYEAFEPGETTLELLYYRGWEGPQTASDSFTATFVVH
jgi:inhibitor of cysteine peptidase